jgi:hypothetical protein
MQVEILIMYLSFEIDHIITFQITNEVRFNLFFGSIPCLKKTFST